ncbi:MAG: helix-turn-helix transcriptional regulator [Clostridia bacterium]|nr:helix-turn-helix transcriptional regulator [Clostridia bacterium]
MIQLIVLSTIIPLVFFALRSTQEKNVNLAHSMLSDGVASFSAEIQAADKLVSMMHKYSEVSSLITADHLSTGSEYYHAAEARNLWYVSTQSWNLLRWNYVYFQKNEVIFTPERIFFDWESFYGYWFHEEGKSFEQWGGQTRQAIRQARKSFYPARKIYMYDIGLKDAILYTIPFADPFNSGMVSCMIDAEALQSILLKSYSPDSSFLGLYDSAGTLLYGRNLPEKAAFTEESIDSLRADGISYRVFFIRDPSTGLSYRIGIPDQAINTGHDGSFWGLLFYSIAILLISSSLSVYFAYRQYSPIKDLYQRFRQLTGTPHSPGQKDEYQYFLESFTGLIRNNQQIRQTLAGYDAALTTRAFEDLLRGRYANGQELHQITGYVSLPEKWRACLAIIEMTGEADEPAAFSLFSVELTSAVCKSWKADVLMHPLRENRVLFIIPVEDTDGPDTVGERLNVVLHAMKRETGLDVKFSLSDVCDTAEQLPAAYEETKSIMACRHSLEGSIYFPEDVDSKNTPPVITSAAAARLREYVQAGEYEKTEEFICSYLKSHYLRERDYSQLFFTIRGILMQMDASLPDGEISSHLPYYLPDKSRDEQTGDLLQAARSLCSSFNSRKRSRNDQLKNRLIAYLQENYADPDIYGRSVAAHFDINEKYLYTFFKEQTGESFASYLETLRLNQAVNLLKNSKFTVNEISQMVGFNSPNTFYKAFRRVYGSSPSVYRNMLQEQDN